MGTTRSVAKNTMLLTIGLLSGRALGVLGGGGVASLRNDPQGKTYAQVLLDYPVPVPRELMEKS